MNPGTTVDPALLLENERWVVRLARALVRDDDEAAELAQAARISLWRRGPDDPERVRSWLGTVLRNLARNRARERARRERRHDQLGPAETPSAEQLAERLETHRVLAELVRGLREPFRQTVLLRYYEGLSAAEIARRLEVPAGTVRWRLKSGLDQLRAALDQRPGGRRAWMALFAGFEPAPRWAPPRWGVALAAGGLLAGGVAGGRALVSDARAPSPAGDVAPRATRAPGPALGAPALLPAAAADPAPMPAWAIEPWFPARPIAGRVVAGGRPVAGATLRLSSGMLTHARAFDRHAVSAADGSFAFAAQAPTNWFLTASAPGLAPQIFYVDLRAAAPLVQPRREPPEALTIELSPCQVFVRGTVRDPGGGAIAAATVKVTAPWNNGGTATHSDADGHYQLCLAAPGAHPRVLVAAADGYATVETLAEYDESTVVDFQLEPGAVVAGRALRADDGATLADVKITLSPLPPFNPNQPPARRTQPVRLETVTDHEGRFELAGLAPGAYRVGARGEGTLGADANRRVEVEPAARVQELEVRLIDTARVEGVARRRGTPVSGVRLGFELRGVPHVPRGHHVLWPSALTAPDGRFQVELPRGAVVEAIVGPWPRRDAPRGFSVDRPHLVGLVVELP